ncbi:MAG TPA: S8 family peptidase, partial [Hanamia sp.]|nr:S8 family peptidase [Hanamia sp.]
SFWQEPEIPFPDPNEKVWWEAWLHRNNDDDINNPFPDLINNLIAEGVQISQRHLAFPEHWVYLLKANVSQLGIGLLYTNRLAELRKPKETAEFFINLNIREQEQLIDDLNERVYVNENRNISVCLLDTGVTIGNPLLSNLVDRNSLDAVEPAWTRADTVNHGTPMAGLIMYGDLSEVLANDDRVQIYHTLESIKLIERNHAHDPELYGAVTEEAVARGEIKNPDNKRVVCMAITADDLIHYGRPSSWSSAIDQLLFGTIDEPNDKTLFFISSGNLPHEERAAYPLVNADHSIKDPAQSFNAITVGAYTLKDQIDPGRFPNTEALANRGAPSPCNTTSIEWDNEWCRKPDIVMEGGNHGIHDGSIRFIDSLELLSTSTGGIGRPSLRTFADTSAATALAAKFAAELYYTYPNLRPETIRGLMIHSANWTPAMLENRKINELNENERKNLVQTVGYGVPNLNKAKESANNSLSIIAEKILRPYKFEDSRIKSNEFHLFDLPWPVEVLQGLFNTEVELKVTLSYFIEPNPGNKRYELAASYRSHGLRFKVIDRGESLKMFKARISKNMREDDYLAEGSEHWLINSNIRDKGSIHKDIWRGSAIDLSRRNKIAVYPVGGWWRTRKQLNRFNHSVRYSLIVTIEAPNVDVDLYSPVLNQIEVEI